jgi:xylulokinase
MARYLLGVDVGTTGTKTKIFDLAGNSLIESYIEYSCVYPKQGWVEQDFSMLLDTLFNSLASVARKASRAGIDLNEIGSMAMATQGILHAYIEKDGQLLRNGMGISWQDNRAAEIVNSMRSFKNKYQEITGLPVTTFLGAAKVKWMMDSDPAVYEKALKVLTVQEYFLHSLGARDGWFQDRSNGSIFGFMDVDKADYSGWILDQFGVDKDKLPELIGSGIMVGRLDENASERTGLPAGIPLCSGGLDGMCAAIGSGVDREGKCVATLGTACVNIAALDSPKRDPSGKLMLAAHSLPSHGWVALGIQPTAGASYKWFRDNIGMMMKMIEPATKTNPYILLDMHAAQAPAGSNGVIFAPSLNGRMFPEYNEMVSGAFVGLSLKTDFGCMARAVMEGVSFETRAVLEAFRSYLDINKVVFAGGGASSPLWRQIQADIFNCPVTVLKDNESTVKGAAILAGVGAGILGNVQEGVEMMVHTDTPYLPNPENARRYEELYGLFQSAYNSLEMGDFHVSHNQYQETYVNFLEN